MFVLQFIIVFVIYKVRYGGSYRCEHVSALKASLVAKG
jgi:hypothetical protein